MKRLPEPMWTRFLPSSVVLGCARLGPLGRLPAPGTWGSLAGLFYFTVFLYHELGPLASALLLLAGIYIAIALCGEAELRLGRKDPSEVILDEFVVMPLVFLGWPWLAEVAPRWAVVATGFTLFRFFDVLKPLGIRRLQELPGGWGIVIDDVAAALAACLTMHAARWAWLWWK